MGIVILEGMVVVLRFGTKTMKSLVSVVLLQLASISNRCLRSRLRVLSCKSSKQMFEIYVEVDEL